MRNLFTDGLNSAIHFGLGYLFGPSFLVPFLAYQFILRPDINSGVDSLEYGAGWLARQAINKNGFNSTVLHN